MLSVASTHPTLPPFRAATAAGLARFFTARQRGGAGAHVGGVEGAELAGQMEKSLQIGQVKQTPGRMEIE